MLLNVVVVVYPQITPDYADFQTFALVLWSSKLKANLRSSRVWMYDLLRNLRLTVFARGTFQRIRMTNLSTLASFI